MHFRRLGSWHDHECSFGVPLEIGIVRPDVVIQCRTAADVVLTGAAAATTRFANGFVGPVPGTINAANRCRRDLARWSTLRVAALRATCGGLT